MDGVYEDGRLTSVASFLVRMLRILALEWRRPSWSSLLRLCAVDARPYPLRQGVRAHDARGHILKALYNS